MDCSKLCPHWGSDWSDDSEAFLLGPCMQDPNKPSLHKMQHFFGFTGIVRVCFFDFTNKCCQWHDSEHFFSVTIWECVITHWQCIPFHAEWFENASLPVTTCLVVWNTFFFSTILEMIWLETSWNHQPANNWHYIPFHVTFLVTIPGRRFTQNDWFGWESFHPMYQLPMGLDQNHGTNVLPMWPRFWKGNHLDEVS